MQPWARHLRCGMVLAPPLPPLLCRSCASAAHLTAIHSAERRRAAEPGARDQQRTVRGCWRTWLGGVRTDAECAPSVGACVSTTATRLHFLHPQLPQQGDDNGGHPAGISRGRHRLHAPPAVGVRPAPGPVPRALRATPAQDWPQEEADVRVAAQRRTALLSSPAAHRAHGGLAHLSLHLLQYSSPRQITSICISLPSSLTYQAAAPCKLLCFLYNTEFETTSIFFCNLR